MRRIKRTAVVGGAVLALVGGGIAFAAWTSTGTGSGSATAASDLGLTVTANAATGLFPTGNVTVTAKVENKNPYKVKLSSITVDSISTLAAGCDASVVTALDNTTVSDTLQPADATPGSGPDTTTVDFTVSMSNAAVDACQDAAFDVDFTATGASSN